MGSCGSSKQKVTHTALTNHSSQVARGRLGEKEAGRGRVGLDWRRREGAGQKVPAGREEAGRDGRRQAGREDAGEKRRRAEREVAGVGGREEEGRDGTVRG